MLLALSKAPTCESVPIYACVPKNANQLCKSLGKATNLPTKQQEEYHMSKTYIPRIKASWLTLQFVA